MGGDGDGNLTLAKKLTGILQQLRGLPTSDEDPLDMLAKGINELKADEEHVAAEVDPSGPGETAPVTSKQQQLQATRKQLSSKTAKARNKKPGPARMRRLENAKEKAIPYKPEVSNAIAVVIAAKTFLEAPHRDPASWKIGMIRPDAVTFMRRKPLAHRASSLLPTTIRIAARLF